MVKLLASFAAGAALALGLSAAALAQGTAAYPDKSRTVQVLVGFSPGGGTDLAARMMAEGLERDLGAKFVVQNYAAGGGLEAVNRLVAARPDGYTIALVPLPASIMLYIDPERGGKFTFDDIVPVATHDYSLMTIATAAKGKWNSLKDVVDAVKARPNSVTGASSGVLALGHLALLQFNRVAGVQLNWTTFDQASLMRSALLGQHIDLEFSGISEVVAAVKSGDIRMLTIFADARLADFPDVPTGRELGYDMNPRSTRTVIAPKGTSPDVVRVLEAAIKRLTENADYKKLADSRQVSLFFQDAAKTKQFWQETETAYRPLVQTFRGR